MADLKKIYKQLKRYDNEDRTDYNENQGKLEVFGDYISASAVQNGQVTEIYVNYEEDDYTLMEDGEHDIFSIMAGILDGSMTAGISEENDKLLQLKRSGKVRIRRKVTGGSAAAMLTGVILLLLCVVMIAVFSAAAAKGGPTALFAVISGISLIGGIILIWQSIRMSEMTFDEYTFTRVDRIPENDTIKRIFQAVCEKTRTDAIEIKLDLERIPTMFSSKIGGVPYWDLSKPYPTDGNGGKMVMLAQFNLAELPENNKLPNKGMLQFFIAPDQSYGRYFDGSNDGHKVVYHSDIDESLTEEQVWKLGISTSLENECFPVSGEFAVDFEVIRVYMTPEDVRINEVIKDASNRMGIYSETYNAIDLFSEEQMGLLKDSGICHGMFGYPCFIQWDPRGETEAKKYDVLLFQLGSEWKNTDSEIYPGRKIMWGDAGVCQFFINQYALSKLDFSDVLYNWEC